MKNKILHLKIFLVLFLIISIIPETPGKSRRKRKVCLKGQDLCGDLCFEKNIFSCQEASNGRRELLCFKNEQSCGDKCYSPYDFNCYGSGEDTLMCPWGHRKCGQKCYDRKTESCSGGVVRTQGEKGNNNNENYNNNRQYNNKQQNNNWDNNRQNSNSSRSSSYNFDNVVPRPKASNYFNSDSSPSNIRPLSDNSYNNKQSSNYNSFSFNDNNNRPQVKSNTYGSNSFSNNPNSYNFNKQNYNENNNNRKNEDDSYSCPTGKRSCGSRCYYPDEQTCFPETANDYNLLCKNGQQRCGSKCFDPYTESCTSNSNNGDNFNNERKQETKKKVLNYNPSDFFDFPISSNTNNNGFNNNNNGCPRGHLICDGRCYNPTEEGCYSSQTRNDNNNNIVKKVKSSFNTNNEGNIDSSFIRKKILPNTNNGCSIGLLKCGSKCYNPREEECLSSDKQGSGSGQSSRSNSIGSQRSPSCSSGQELCGRSKCFDPFNERCLDDGNGGKIPCRWNEKVCGAKCYDKFYNCKTVRDFK